MLSTDNSSSGFEISITKHAKQGNQCFISNSPHNEQSSTLIQSCFLERSEESKKRRAKRVGFFFLTNVSQKMKYILFRDRALFCYLSHPVCLAALWHLPQIHGKLQKDHRPNERFHEYFASVDVQLRKCVGRLCCLKWDSSNTR